MNIIEKYLPINSLRRSGQKITAVKFIVCHDTGNSGSTASGNVSYFIKSANEISASAHFFVDDKETINCIPENEKAWHVRYLSKVDNTMYMADANDVALGVELCYGGEIDNQKAYSNYCALIAHLCIKYHLNPRKDLVAHQTLDASHRTDPLNAFSKIGKTWEQFIEDVSAITLKVPQTTNTHMETTIPEGSIEVLSQDGATKDTMKKPNFETQPNSHYCMITSIELHPASDVATVNYSNFTTDEHNVIHLLVKGYMECTACASNEDAIAYAKNHVDAGIIVEVNI